MSETQSDGLPIQDVGEWAKDKHLRLRRYLDISRATRKKFLGAGKGGATLIDLYCGPGRARIRDTGELIDGSAIAAWKISAEGDSPFSEVYIADADDASREACAARLKALGANVKQLPGAAVEAARSASQRLSLYGLHFAFLDPFNLEALDFEIIRSLSKLKRIDLLIHLSAMDLNRNFKAYEAVTDSALDRCAPGWRDNDDRNQADSRRRTAFIEHWKNLLAGLSVWPSPHMELITGKTNQPLYWLVLAARHELAQKFWKETLKVPGQQGTLF